MSEITIEVKTDAHGDIYYRVLYACNIIADRINSRHDLMLYLEAKIKDMSK